MTYHFIVTLMPGLLGCHDSTTKCFDKLKTLHASSSDSEVQVEVKILQLQVMRFVLSFISILKLCNQHSTL